MSVIPAAISDVDGHATFEISRYSTAMSKLEDIGDWNTVAVAHRRIVTTKRIDTLAASMGAPDVLKIDVEGAEVKVLHGASVTIAGHRPIILIEGPSMLWDPMTAFFHNHRYTMFDAAAPRDPINHPVWDTLAVPSERL